MLKKPYDPSGIFPEDIATLDKIYKRAREESAPKVAVFDLDSTLFDNRPRQAHIFREFGLLSGNHSLYHVHAQSFDDWGFISPLIRAGLTEQEATAIYPSLRQYWMNTFFTSAYCIYDVAFPGAMEFVHALLQEKSQIVYVTGRHEDMRAGTLESLKRFHFPIPATHPDKVRLLMKPKMDLADTVYKAEVKAEIDAIGKVFAAFDNEPAHANQHKASFPEADVVWIKSDHSLQADSPRLDLLSISGFLGFLKIAG